MIYQNYYRRVVPYHYLKSKKNYWVANDTRKAPAAPEKKSHAYIQNKQAQSVIAPNLTKKRYKSFLLNSPSLYTFKTTSTNIYCIYVWESLLHRKFAIASLLTYSDL